ncbi:hypothetical protein RRG08_045283 [Elysia crispata]|uniref:Uncharacterized protein n=1 Tax=Elysia crispata TaxID=231223 RepID=A0AAE1DR03_9GAST|nr:hypothetical protein RRG08_045283 [Elysia crispata]
MSVNVELTSRKSGAVTVMFCPDSTPVESSLLADYKVKPSLAISPLTYRGHQLSISDFHHITRLGLVVQLTRKNQVSEDNVAT